MKTKKEHLESLPEPYRTQAINNMIEAVKDCSSDTPLEALCGAFVWAKSEEGHDYWKEFATTLPTHPNDQ